MVTYFALTLKENQAGLHFSEIIEEKRVLQRLNKTQPFFEPENSPTPKYD